MKVKKVIDLCRQTKRLNIMNDNNKQWITNGFACYYLEGLPRFTTESLCSAYEITNKQASDMRISDNNELIDIYNYHDLDETEEGCERDLYGIHFSDSDIVPYYITSGVLFLEEKYLLPFSAMMDNIEIYVRINALNKYYFVVKQGFFLKAIITPCKVVNSRITTHLQTLLEKCKRSLIEKEGFAEF